MAIIYEKTSQKIPAPCWDRNFVESRYFLIGFFLYQVYMIRKLDFGGFLSDLDPLWRGIAHRNRPVYKGNAGVIGNSL